jgi:DNA-binding NarL/FixJ family response regulator
MKITVTPAGELVIDADAAETASLIKSLRNGKVPHARKAKKQTKALESESVPLSNALVDTWNWLVANDTADGLSSQDVARGLDLKPHTATYRLNTLVEKDLAFRVVPGRYRAGSS